MRRGLVLAATLFLCGCPADWGFAGRVLSLPEGAVIGGQVFVPEIEHPSPSGAPVRGVQITCDGCDHLVVEPDGRFHVHMGMAYDRPHGVVLHVRAPGHDAVDVRVDEMPVVSQLGPGTITIVLARSKP